MATSVGSRAFLIASLILCNAQEPPDSGRITFLRSSIELTQRSLSCPGEALTLTCTSSGKDIRWDSDPSLWMSGNQTIKNIDGFICSDVVVNSFSDRWNYTNGTAFFVSRVLENVVPGGDCNSSITFVPIPNDEGQYPTSFAPNGLFNITCTTGSIAPRIEPQSWVYRVADTPMPVPESSATCTYYASHKVVRINITRETTTQDDSEELRHYVVSLNGTSMNTTAVSAQSENPNGLLNFNFYPVEPEEDNMSMMAQIVAVDMCGQRSDQTVIRCETVSPSPTEIPTCAPTTTCTQSNAATYMYILAPIIILAILIKQILMC